MSEDSKEAQGQIQGTSTIRSQEAEKREAKEAD
jgi:hypothetical protein